MGRLGKMESNISESSRITPRSVQDRNRPNPQHDSRKNQNINSLFDPSVKVLSPSNFKRRSKKALVLTDDNEYAENSKTAENEETKSQVIIKPKVADTPILGSPSATPA